MLEKELQDLKEVVDFYYIERIWKLILTDHRLFTRISKRYPGIKRLKMLKAYIAAMDYGKLNSNHSFELILFSCIDK